MKTEQAKQIKSREEARQFAIDWQKWAAGEQNLSYGEILMWEDVLRKLGRDYYLTAEFKENGIL